MSVILSELRVSASMEASGFTTGAGAIEAANRRMADSGQAAGAAMAAQDAAVGRTGGTLITLSRGYVDGYSGAAKLNTEVSRLQTQFELGNVSADRAAQIYTGISGKLNLYADATKIAAGGNRDFATVIDSVNAKAALQIDILGRASAAQKSSASAQAYQSQINTNLGVVEPGANTAASQADILAYGNALDAVRAKYVPLAAAQKEYLTTLADIRSNVKTGALTQAEGAAAISRTKESFAQQVVVMNTSGQAMAGHSRGMGGLTTQASALAAALRHMFDAMAAGMSPMRVIMMEMGNLSYGLSGVGALGGVLKGVFSSLGSAIMSVWGLVGGVVALGAAALIMNSIWKSSALQFDDLSKTTNTTIRTLRELESAAAFKGISTADFFSSMEKFNADIYKAKNNMGGLAEVFQANGIRAKTFNDYLEKAADIIKNTADGEQRLAMLRQMGLPATMQWVRYLQDGAEGIRKAQREAVGFGNAAENEMIKKAREFDEAWDRGWKNFANYAKAAFADIKAWQPPSWMQKILGLFSGGTYEAGFGYGPGELSGGPLPGGKQTGQGGIGSDSRSPLTGGKQPVDPEALKRQIALTQQYLGILGQQETVEQHILAVTKQIELYNLQPGAITLTEKQVANLKRLAEEQALGTAAMKQQADTSRIEAATIGMTTGAATAYRLEQERIALALRNKEPLSAKNLADLRTESQAAGAAAHALALRNIQYEIKRGSQTAFLTSEDVQIAEKLKNVYPDVATALNSVEAAGMRMNNMMKGSADAFTSSINGPLLDFQTGVKTGTEAIADFQKQFTRSLLAMMNQMIIMAPIARMLQGILSGGAGGVNLLSFLGIGGAGGNSSPAGGTNPFGGSGTAVSAMGNVFDQGRVIHPYALGGITSDIIMKPSFFRMANGGLGSAGENAPSAPEAIMPLTRINGRLGVQASGGGGTNVQVNVINNAKGTKVEEKRRDEGGINIVDVIISTVDSHMAKGGFNPTMGALYGAKPIGRLR